MSDDGVGVRAVRELAARFRFPAGVRLLDGGTLGLDLLPQLEGVERLLIIDAVETGREPGALARLAGDEVPTVFAPKLSPHQMGLSDLLAVAELQGVSPRETVLWGVQPAFIGLGTDLSPVVAAQLETIVDNVLQELERWGMRPLCRSS